jgi:hypothetical protein
MAGVVKSPYPGGDGCYRAHNMRTNFFLPASTRFPKIFSWLLMSCTADPSRY